MCEFTSIAPPDFVESSSCTMDEVVDIIAVMQAQERTIYLRSDYLANGSYADVLDASWRQRIVEWMFGVVDHCSLRRDSVAVASVYLDLCVERGVVTSRLEFQLAAMTALQLAIKLYDSTVVKLDSMIKLGRGLFTEQDVIAMESKMLSALKWQVHPPTSICFLRQFLRLLPPSVSPLSRYVLAEVTRFIAEISVCLYKFVDCPTSVIAYAGMLIAMDKIDSTTLPPCHRQEVYECMSTAANLDHHSPQVVEAVNRLKASLEKNVSLQSLMRTIDSQCRVGGYYQPSSVSISDSATTVDSFRDQTNTVNTNLNSPRDVFVSSNSQPLKTYGM